MKIKNVYDHRDLHIPFNINYQSTVETYIFITYSDMIAKFGGLKSALTPVVNLMLPVLAVCYLVQISKMIKQKSKNKYKDELIEFIKTHIEDVQKSKKIELIK